MRNLNKKDIVLFAQKVVNQPGFVPFNVTSECGKMTVEITTDCPVISRTDVESNIVQVNSVIANKYKKSTILFFIVWGFLKGKETRDYETDNETMLLLNLESPGWCPSFKDFVADFTDILSVNDSSENQQRCNCMVHL